MPLLLTILIICLLYTSRSGNNAIFHIVDTIKRIYEFSKAVFVQADSHRIDGEVTAVLVILQRSIFHNRLSGIALIALLTGCLLYTSLVADEQTQRVLCLTNLAQQIGLLGQHRIVVRLS